MCILLSGIIMFHRLLNGSKDTLDGGVKIFEVEEDALVPQLRGTDSYYYGAVNDNFCQGILLA